VIPLTNGTAAENGLFKTFCYCICSIRFSYEFFVARFLSNDTPGFKDP
jgi:hypothetical protein